MGLFQQVGSNVQIVDNQVTVDTVLIRPSTGVPYVFTAIAGGGPLADDPLSCYKGNAAPPTSFSLQDSGNAPTPSAGSYYYRGSGVIVGDVIHLITMLESITASGDVHYHTFDMSTDTWGITDELVEDPGIGVVTSTHPSIALRADGDVIALYADQARIMGVDYSRVDYARRESGSWTVGISVDGVSTETDWGGQGVIGPDSSDRIYFYYRQALVGSHFKCLRSDNTLSAASSPTSEGRTCFGAGVIIGGQAIHWEPTSTVGARIFSASLGDSPTFTSEVVGTTDVESLRHTITSVPGLGAFYVLSSLGAYRRNSPEVQTVSGFTTFGISTLTRRNGVLRLCYVDLVNPAQYKEFRTLAPPRSRAPIPQLSMTRRHRP